jgi:hypothetical protein
MTQQKKYINREDFIKDRVSMHLGSLMNLYSNSKNPPSPDELFLKAIEITEKIWDLGKRFDEFPELDSKLQEKAFEEYCLHERQVGRYYASELWYYLNGKIAPEQFLNPPLPTNDELKRLYWGTTIHAGIQAIFGYEEKKYEINFEDGITIVCKPDLILEDGTIVEIKTKEDIEIYDNLPQYYEYQCQAYLEALKKKEMRLYLIGWGFSRKLFKVKKNNILWQNIVEGLKEYHIKVVNSIKQMCLFLDGTEH